MGISSLIGAGISGAASLFGASQQASASKKAAQAQVQAAQIAADTQRQMFQQTQNNLAPYLAVGKQGSEALGNRLTELTTSVPLPPSMTQADLEATPGYQFTLSQGLKATQNNAAARGLGLSGAAIKGAANYATGLSDQTYNTRFAQGQQLWQDQVTNQGNNFNRLLGTAGIGASAAGVQGQIGAATASGISNNLMAAGGAQAAGINGEAAAWNSGINGAANAANAGMSGYNQNALMQALLQGGAFSKNGSSIDTSQFGLGNKLMGLYSG